MQQAFKPGNIVNGSFTTMYKQALLCRIMSRLSNQPSPWTFINATGGAAAYKLNKSINNRDAMYLHRWIGQKLGDKKIPPFIDTITPYIALFRDINKGVEFDEYGNAKQLYMPSINSCAQYFMRNVDNSVILENNQTNLDTLYTVFGNDKRVEIVNNNQQNESIIKSIVPPVSKNGIIYYNLPEDTSYLEQSKLKATIISSIKRFPDGIHYISYPIKKGKLPWGLFHILASTGIQNAYHVSMYADNDVLAKRLHDLAPEPENNNNNNKNKIKQALGLEQYYGSRPISLKSLKPDNNWDGIGIAVLNAPIEFEKDALEVSISLKSLFGLPMGERTQRISTIHEPYIAEYGESYKKLSVANKGIFIQDRHQSSDPADVLQEFRLNREQLLASLFAKDGIDVSTVLPLDDALKLATNKDFINNFYSNVNRSVIDNTYRTVRLPQHEIKRINYDEIETEITDPLVQKEMERWDYYIARMQKQAKEEAEYENESRLNSENYDKDDIMKANLRDNKDLMSSLLDDNNYDQNVNSDGEADLTDNEKFDKEAAFNENGVEVPTSIKPFKGLTEPYNGLDLSDDEKDNFRGRF